MTSLFADWRPRLLSLLFVLLWVTIPIGCAPMARPSGESFASSADLDTEGSASVDDGATAEGVTHTLTDDDERTDTDRVDTGDDSNDDSDSNDIGSSEESVVDELIGFADGSAYPGAPPFEINMSALSGESIEPWAAVTELTCREIDVEMGGDNANIFASDARLCHYFMNGNGALRFAISLYNPTETHHCGFSVEHRQIQVIGNDGYVHLEEDGYFLLLGSSRPDFFDGGGCLAPQGRGWIVGYLSTPSSFDDNPEEGLNDLAHVDFDLQQAGQAIGFSTGLAVKPTEYAIDSQTGLVTVQIENVGSDSLVIDYDAFLVGFDATGIPVGFISVSADDWENAGSLAVGEIMSFTEPFTGVGRNLWSSSSTFEVWTHFTEPE